MKTSVRFWLGGIAVGLALVFAGCKDSHSHEESGQHPAGGHAHEAKYGGKLIELGDHEANLELVVDASAGKLTAYVLDAHAENFVRLPLDSITVVAKAGATDQTLVLKPVGNAATGEKPGDTSQFEASADWIKSTPTFSVVIRELPVKSKTYRDVQTTLPK